VLLEEFPMKKKHVLAVLLVISLLSACAQTSPTFAPTAVGQSSPTPLSSPISPTPTVQPSEASPAAAEQAAIQFVATNDNIPAGQITVVSVEPMTWTNGCMGVVIPGVLCTDVIVHGFIVILDANGQQFEIHTNQDGTSVIDAAQQLATLGFVVMNADQTIQIVNPEYPLHSTYHPSFDGFLPTGGSIGGTAYVLNTASLPGAVEINSNSQQVLSFIQQPTYGLAVWSGDQTTPPMLAWGTQPTTDTNTTSLMVASPDGSDLQTLLTLPVGTPPIQLVAELWSADGKSLYFSKEPVGLGGYIIFSGASNLYKIDLASKQVTEIIPIPSSTQVLACLDAISLNHNYVADHCTPETITVQDLQNGTATSIQSPVEVTNYRLLGSARFSPSGNQVAFAMAMGNPDDEHGWVAVGSSSGGTAKLILTSDGGTYYNVLGWLNETTLLVQSVSVNNPNGTNQLIIVGSDGSNPTKAAEGLLLAIISSR
jgi:hypothetical protein